MNFNSQVLFFFSALGAFNGLFLSLYFAFLIKNRNKNTYFLAALLFVISIRVTKSVFKTFYPETSSAFINVGLTACFLIGPFLYLYTKITVNPDGFRKWRWLIHVVPVLIFMSIIGYLFPYKQYYYLWWKIPPKPLGILLISQWTLYLIASLYTARNSFKHLFSKTHKVSTLDFWILTINIGGFLIWLGYSATMYTSYIVGALSFSFTFYITILLWFFKRRKTALSFFSPSEKYANKKIDNIEAENISKELIYLFEEKELHKNPNLKLPELAELIGVKTYYLSQYFNDNINKSFATYINEYRVNSAVKMIETNNILTIEAIGNECGFRSNSSFYTAFKKVKGITPAQYKKSLS